MLSQNADGATLMPGFTNGGTIIAACPAYDNATFYGEDKNCDALPNISNVVILGLNGTDDDPTAHCLGYSTGDRGYCNGSEETHFLTMENCDRCAIINGDYSSFGDETITMINSGASFARNNRFTNTPSIPYSGGAGIVLEGAGMGAVGNTFVSSSLDPNGDCPADSCDNIGAFIRIETNVGGDVSNMEIVNNVMLTGSGNVRYGLQIGASQGRTTDILIAKNDFRLENAPDGAGCKEPTTAATLPDGPGDPFLRCAIVFDGGSFSNTALPLVRENLTVEDNTLIGGLRVSDVGGTGRTNISNNTISGTGFAGFGLQAAGNPLVVTGNLVDKFNGPGLLLYGFEDDLQGSESVRIANNTFQGNNLASVAEQLVEIFAPVDPCGTDGVIPGGVTFDNNTFDSTGSPAGSIKHGIRDVDGCLKLQIIGNTFTHGDSETSDSETIFGMALASHNRILSPAIGIAWWTSDVVVADNFVQGASSRGIYGKPGNVPPASAATIANNVVESSTGGNLIGIDATGTDNSCVANITQNLLAQWIYDIECGTDTGADTCAVDAPAAGAYCARNVMCSTTVQPCPP
jgi:hypothetical protein